MPTQSPADARHPWRPVLMSFLIVFIVFLASPNVLPRGDAALSIPTAQSLLHERNVDLSEFVSVPWVADHYALTDYHGRQVDYFPWLVSASAVPFVAAIDLVALTGITPSTDELIRQDRSWVVHYVAAGFWSAMAAVLLAILTLQFLHRWDITWADPTTRIGRVAASRPLVTLSLVIAFSTQLWSITSRSLAAHAPALACIAGAMVLASGVQRSKYRMSSAVAAGALCAIAFWIRPVTVVATGVVALLIALHDRKRLIGFLGGTAATHLVILATNQLLYGARPPYFESGRLGLHSAYAEAMAANLVSPARGLLLFCPQVVLVAALLVPRVRQQFSSSARPTVIILLAATAGVLLVVSAYGYQWWAGHTYGPRYMSDALPFFVPVTVATSVVLLRLAPSKLARALIGLLWAVAVVVHFQGGWFHSTECWNGGRRPNIDTSPGRVWSVSDPQITSGFRTLIEHGAPEALWAACGADAEQVKP
jgi:hypothetical protein